MKRKIPLYISLLIVLFFACYSIQAQEQATFVKSTVKETINGKQYYIHTVQPKETAYGIARLYQISFQELATENPGLENGLAIGQLVKIPVKNIQESQIQTNSSQSKETVGSLNTQINKSKEIQIINNKEYFVHTIESGQTLYSISKTYNVPVDSIKKTNPNIINGLSVGTKIFIENLQKSNNTSVASKPIEQTITNKPEEIITTEQVKISNKDIKLKSNKKSISIALLLPFQVDNSNSANTIEIINKKIEISNSVLPFIEYYEGVLVAIDSLRKNGITVNLKVFDTKKDSMVVQQALQKIKDDKVDLIIGPVYQEQFIIAAEFAKKYKIPIVSPLSSDEIPITNNPFAIQINSPQKYRYQEISKFASQYKNAHIIFVYNSIDLEQSQVTECKKILNSMYADSITKNSIQIKEVYFPKLGIGGVEKALNPNATNILIVPSRNQAFINNLVTKLYQFSKKYSIHLIGLPIWEKYENLELDFLFDLQFQFVTNGYIDYADNNVISFVEKYREMFKAEPTKFSFQGFDQMLYFSECLLDSKQDFLLNILTTDKVGLHDSYDFVTNGATSGIVNTATSMIYYTKSFQRKNMHNARITEEPVKIE